MGRARRVTSVFAWLGGATTVVVAACDSGPRQFHGAAGAEAGGRGGASRGGTASGGKSGDAALNQAGNGDFPNAGQGGTEPETAGATGQNGGSMGHTGGTGTGSGGTTGAGGPAGRTGSGGTGMQAAGGDAGMSGQAGEGGAAPECVGADPPRCKDGATSETCSHGAWQTAACGGKTPTCVDGIGCAPCTEHSDCPASACHLAGPKQGTCFAVSTVVNVADAAALVSGVTGLSSGTERVFRLSAGTYTLSDTLTLANSGEVAFVGVTGTVISGGPNFSDQRNPAFLVNSSANSAITYFASFAFSGTSASSGLQVFGTAYLDDIRISGYYRAFAVSGELHTRRSWLASSGLGSYASGSLFMENSALGPNGDSVEGLQIGGSTTIDFRYVTFAGSMNAIDCLNAVPPVGGTVRNSIFASTTGDSVYGGTNGSNCSTIQFAGSAVDQVGFGTEIAWYNDTWFKNAAMGDFHLTNVGKSAIPKTASRGSDDPTVDLDGDPRPASNGYPGLDEP